MTKDEAIAIIHKKFPATKSLPNEFLEEYLSTANDRVEKYVTAMRSLAADYERYALLLKEAE